MSRRRIRVVVSFDVFGDQLERASKKKAKREIVEEAVKEWLEVVSDCGSFDAVNCIIEEVHA